ncbi:portal protein [Fusobacterium sp. CAG:439]|nr:portal protein [Fusobacterium sp. CAG:439]
MKIEAEDLTQKLSDTEERFLVSSITEKYDKFNDQRSAQLTDIKLVRDAIYNSDVPKINGWDNRVELPDIYELAQTLKSHISENLYSHPDAMFDVSGTTPQTQGYANKQKAMLVNTFEQMNIEDEIEKVIDSIVETGESTLFVGWETKIKTVRRAKTIEEQILKPDKKGFTIDEKVIYDNAKVKHIKSEDFVFDKFNKDNWDKCAKIYRTYSTIDELYSDKSNNCLDDRKLEILKGVVASRKSQNNDENAVEGKKVEILEFWGDIELSDGTFLKNWLIVVAARREVIRFESNPFVINPFIHANIIESPRTGRGISPLRVALILNSLASTILNKQIDALTLMMNPPYLAPKGCFKGQQDVKPGKIIEYDAALMPTAPTPLAFDKAMVGWDFLNYFKSTIESATGIFKNMAGNLQSAERTATELNYSVSGQEARLNMILDSINRKIIVPMVEKTAEIISNFKLGKELIGVNDRGKTSFMEIDDNVRNGNYIYRYGDRRASFERKMRLKELFEVVQSFAQVPEVEQKIDWLECFKFALEQYGIENANNFLISEDKP